MSRGKFAQWMLFGLVFVVGALTLVQQVGGYVSHFAHSVVTHTQTYANGSSGTGGPDQASVLSAASFDYLIPGKSTAWKMDDGQSVYDPGKGIVKYQVTFNNAKVDASITQQVFPDQLKPRSGDKFTAFINNSKPSRSADVNLGTVYFLPMLQNGALAADGTDTVIFARDDVLMFGQASGKLGWDAWTQMMASMQKHS
jgi:hypothetical protein